MTTHYPGSCDHHPVHDHHLAFALAVCRHCDLAGPRAANLDCRHLVAPGFWAALAVVISVEAAAAVVAAADDAVVVRAVRRHYSVVPAC